ncbi:MAG: DUF4450 domain-containing protein [Prevotella sp.]|nr:DUF4450 domain-containing protein [Prevotella sp.]
MKRIWLLFTLLVGLSASAQQQKIGDFIESTSYNLDKIGVSRSQQYQPRHGSFVCENGENRYTRALYGSYTDWRLETSDRPVFAVVKKDHHRNIRFVLEIDGVAYSLDQTDYCRASYRDGRREYQLKDKRWGEGVVRIEVLAMPDREAAVWRIASPQFEARLRVIVCQIAQPKLHRNGDIGADKPGCLEAAGDPLQTVELAFGKSYTAYLEVDLDQLRQMEPEAGWRAFQQARSHYRQLASRIRFQTPDPYINTLGGALVLAADGDWDGQTWLHGCVGWRMPLAGWRAGYLGDVLGWNERAVSHFNAYAKSQVTNVEPVIPHPSQDPKMNLARAEKKWGTQMYSNGYICRNPERNDQMHHYDMNLNYMDELLWHFQYDADTAYMRKMWPVITSHLAWEKRNYDPDGDHLYDAYCCIWASDALYYNGGAVTHSSAYNYRGNKLAARIAEMIGENPQPYRDEAEAILKAMNERLWLSAKGVWAEYQDAMGLKRTHDHPAVWSIYTPIDCGACTPEQAYQATRYVDAHIPHIDVEDTGLQTIATSDWLPYSWSINNVAAAEVMHTALAYFEAGRAEEAYRLMKANILDQMYYGASPGNFGQVSYYDAARGECYRDFGDCIGISSRTLLQGLFGIIPQALDGKCIIRPGFPEEWDSASVKTPYLEYRFTRKDGVDRYEITQNFRRSLKIVLRQNLGGGQYRDIEGSAEACQVIEAATNHGDSPRVVRYAAHTGDSPHDSCSLQSDQKFRPVRIGRYFNAEVDDIFKNEYLSPRPQTTTLQIPTQGIGEWCHPQLTAEINDSVFRTLIKDGQFVVAGVPFRTPAVGNNIVYTSLWDNYPDAVTIPVDGKAETAWLLMAGSTNHMQSRIDNGLVIATYRDGSQDTLALRNPDNWCPIEQDYYVDGKAFQTLEPRPCRVCLGTGDVSRDLGKTLGIQGVYGREIPGGAAQMLPMPLNPRKRLRSLTVRTLSNDVVIGLMAVTLQ